MPDATYVGAGMPCGNCGNPLTAGQPHKCGRTPDFDRRLDESWEPSPAASPDERLREAVAALPQYVITIQDREGYTYERGCEGQPMNYTGVMLADVEALVGKLKDGATTARETTNELKDAAADREKPPAGSDGEDR